MSDFVSLPHPKDLFSQVEAQIEKKFDLPIPASFRVQGVSIENAILNTNAQQANPFLITPWMKKRIAYSGPTYVALSPTLFTFFSDTTSSSQIDSQDGRLVVDVVDQNYLLSYSADIYRKTNPASINLNVQWTQSMAVFLNGVQVFSSQLSAMTPQTINLLLLGTQWNTLEILLYSSVVSQRFDIGVALKSVSEGWRSPAYNEIAAPTGLTVAIDGTNIASRYANTNVVGWNPNTEVNIRGYRIYRKGPYVS